MNIGNDMRSMAVQRLAAAREHVRDLEGFIRVYDDLAGGHVIPTPSDEERQSLTTPQVVLGATAGERPVVSLADPNLSQLDAAEKVMRIHLRPMKPADIAHRMLLWGFPYENGVEALKASVGSMLARAVRDAERTGPFVRLGSGLFGLREWGEEDEQSEVPLFGAEQASEDDKDDGNEIASEAA